MGGRARGSALGVLFLEEICLPAPQSSGCSRGVLTRGQTLLLYRGFLKIFFQSQGWQGQLVRKLFFPNPLHSYFWFLETHKARGPQDVQDADKINTGELSVSYHQLQFTSVLDFTEHKTKGPAPCLFSVKFSKITQTRMLHVKQETAERRYKKDERRWEQLWKELFVRLQFLVLPNSQMESLGIGASI